jgi:PAS domain S-box-containing protein
MPNNFIGDQADGCRSGPEDGGGVAVVRRPRREAFLGILALMALSLGMSLLSPSVRANDAPRRALLLNSYHQGYLWTDEITRGVEDALAGTDVELHIEYMDTKRQFDPTYQDLLRRMLRHKHRKHHYAVIISSDNNAFDFLKEWGPPIFGATPVVFCGVNYLKPADVEGWPNFTGVNERLNIEGNLALIRRLHPERTKIVVVTDDTTTGKQNQEAVRQIAARAENHDLQVELLYDVGVDDLQQRIQMLDDRAVVLFTVFIRDKNDVFLGYEQGLKLVCDQAPVPVYAVQNFRTGPCVVGGYLTNGYDQGRVAADKAKEILDGRPVAEIPIRWDTPTRARFDYRNLRRFGIPLDRLPPGSEILHQPVSFYYQNKTLIWNTVIAFGLLLLALCSVVYGLIRSRQAAVKLQRNEENLRTTLDSIGDAVIATDTSGRVVRMNPVAETLTGWRATEAAGRPLAEVFNIVHALTGEPAENPVLRVMATGEVVGLANHTRLIARGGAQYPIADSAAPIRATETEMTGVVLVFRDVTETYEKDRQLRESERKYRQLVENANDAIFIAQGGMIQYANRKTSELVGYDSEALKTVSFAELIHPEDREMVADRHVRRLKGETELPSTYAFRIVDREGAELVVQLSTVLIEWNGQPATLNFARDITAKQKMEASLQQAQKLEAIGTLAGGVAHDFNNLLLGVQGRASLMALDLPAAHPHQEHVRAIEEYVRSATNLTRQLLGVARGGKYDPQPTDLNDLVGRSATMFGRTRKEIQVHRRMSPTPVIADVDRQQIEQVLLNIYVNAWQAMPEGGDLYLETRRVILDQAVCAPHANGPGSYACITVTDTGTGMDAATRERIFDPFFTTKAKGRGTGLGLASAYGIVKNHDGFITVSSVVGRGSTFTIYLPASPKVVAAEASVRDEILRGSETILLVDDEAIIIEVGRAILERLGYRVITADGGEQALEVMRTEGENIDLVILDLIMPGLDGGKTFDRIRELQPAMPVILASGYAISGQATAIMRRGCNGFMQKPFGAAALSQKIRQVLEAAGC